MHGAFAAGNAARRTVIGTSRPAAAAEAVTGAGVCAVCSPDAALVGSLAAAVASTANASLLPGKKLGVVGV